VVLVTGATCPVCGKHAPIWLGAPPDGCLAGEAGLCVPERQDAARAALWRRLCPDAFDATGAILPGVLGDVITRVAAAGYDPISGRRRDA